MSIRKTATPITASGQIAGMAGDWVKARSAKACFRQALQIDPSYADSHHDQVLAYTHTLGRADDAAEQLRANVVSRSEAARYGNCGWAN